MGEMERDEMEPNTADVVGSGGIGLDGMGYDYIYADRLGRMHRVGKVWFRTIPLLVAACGWPRVALLDLPRRGRVLPRWLQRDAGAGATLLAEC